MKKIFTPLPLLAFLMLFCTLAQAQNYQPFRRNHLYQFIARDSVYSMRIDTAKVVGGDSVFVFNPTAKPGIIRTGSANCVGTNSLYHAQTNNQFGHWMKELPNGDYIFHAAQGKEFLLKTQTPLNSSWSVSSNPSINATVVSITMDTFNGVTDLVKTINLNNGTQIKLSQNYGFVQAPNFMAYVPNSDFKRRTLLMHKLPVKKPFHSSILKYYDFQPGDKFSFFTDSSVTTLRHHIWDQYEILSRVDGIFGDEITYTLTHQRLLKSWGWSPGTFTQISPATTYNYTVSIYDYFPDGELATNEFHEPGAYIYGLGYGLGTVLTKTTRNSNFNQRETSTFTNQHYSQQCKTFYFVYDFNRDFEYTAGLGKTYDHYDDGTIPCVRTLQAYIKGIETYGTWRTFTQIMGTKEDKEPLPFSAFPNPFAGELTLKFSSTFTGEKATVSITNLLGQEIYQQQLTASPNQEINLELPEMAKGVYVLRVTENGRTHTSRLVKE
jgi:hypothetical protein